MSEQTIPPQAGLAPTAGTLPADVRIPGPEAGVPDAPTAEPPRRRRRRLAVLAILLILLGVFALFAGWYLATRKPISELPIVPPVVAADVPSYGYSIYGTGAPTGVAVNGTGDRLYVAQTGGDGNVQVFDAKGVALGELKAPALTTGNHVPVYVAVNPATQDVYVSDRATGAMYIYSADGVYRRTFDPGTARKGWQPLGIGFGSDGTMYVTDVALPQKVHQFAPDGTWVRTIQPEAAFNFPNGVWPDSSGNVYVADSSNGRLRVYAPDGRELGGVPRGAREGELGLPRGVAIDDQGRIFVVDTTAHSVQVYKVPGSGDRQPPYVGRFGVQGSADGTFQFPNGIAVDARGHVFVTDMANNRVQVWSY
jgi:DNA-binding beta-propeller fold protein YncE